MWWGANGPCHSGMGHKFLVRESFLKKVIKQKGCLKEILGVSGSQLMAYWEKLLQHVVQELYACGGSGSSCSVGDGSSQAVRRVGAARARAGYARALAVCALGWHLSDAV